LLVLPSSTRSFLFNRALVFEAIVDQEGIAGVQEAQRSVHIIAATVGFLSFSLIWLAIVWGLVLRNGWASTRIRHATAYGIHQTMALLGLTLAVVHAFAQLANPLGHVRLLDEFLPFGNPVDPVGIGVGVIGLEVMSAAALSVLIQRKLGYSRWRALHAMTYVAYMLVVAHILISGSDVGPSWVWGSVMGAWLFTVLLWLTTTPWLRTIWRGAADRMSVRRHGIEVSVDVDPVRCKRFGFCEHEAPEVFKLRTDGRLSYLAAVPADEIDGVIRAMKVCPARAIAVSQVPTAMMTAPRPKDEPESVPSGPRRATVTGLHRDQPGM
jgi:ferredoxin/DMSO/TMAO reductase YedYZ heme-binding membrane subunit